MGEGGGREKDNVFLLSPAGEDTLLTVCKRSAAYGNSGNRCANPSILRHLSASTIGNQPQLITHTIAIMTGKHNYKRTRKAKTLQKQKFIIHY
jgi:hypothetical protein